MYEIAEAWKYIKPKCGCHGENKIDMVIQEGPASLFYACPKYHPENREPGERACNNRLNLIEYQKMVEKLTGMIAEADCEGGTVDLTNFHWSAKGVEYNVLEHKGDHITVEIKNIRAMRM